VKILVLGGTQFVGRHIVEELVAAGHQVSIFTRGQTPDVLPPIVERIHGDRDDGPEGLRTLSGHSWDVCIDVSGYTARHVRSSAEKLRSVIGHYVYVSAVSVYGDPKHGPVDETHPRLFPADESENEVTGETYGPLKVRCENIVQELYGDKSTVLRPQVVAGAFDPYDRFSYWVRRASQGGEMLAPGDGTDFVQVVDVRDVAQFTRKVCENGLPGSFNLAGIRTTWKAFLATLGAQNLTWVPASFLKAEGLDFRELPLFRPNGGPRSGLMHVSNERAVQAGLSIRAIADTAHHVRTWLQTDPHLTPALSLTKEAALLAKAKSEKSR
jgi:2'-hydroxyisoflavone reductase